MSTTNAPSGWADGAWSLMQVVCIASSCVALLVPEYRGVLKGPLGTLAYVYCVWLIGRGLRDGALTAPFGTLYKRFLNHKGPRVHYLELPTVLLGTVTYFVLK